MVSDIMKNVSKQKTLTWLTENKPNKIENVFRFLKVECHIFNKLSHINFTPQNSINGKLSLSTLSLFLSTD